MNRTRGAAFPAILFLFICQNLLGFFLKEATPLLVLTGVIFYALVEGPRFGFAAGLFGGFLADLLTAEPLGIQMLTFACVGLFCGFFSSKIFRESILTQILLPFLVSLFVYREKCLDFLPAIFFTVCAAPFIFIFLKRISSIRKERTPWA